MGLDITYYRKLTESQGNEAFDETGELKYEEGWFQIYANPDFPGREDGLKDRHAYKAEESFGFCADSYGGYNHWRDELAKLAGYSAVPVDRYGTGHVKMRHDQSAWNADGGPFWELICFSDCEGAIGPVTSAKLAKDFAEHQDKADAHPEERFRNKYAEWRKAFEVASDGGAVRFH